MVDLEEVKKM